MNKEKYNTMTYAKIWRMADTVDIVNHKYDLWASDKKFEKNQNYSKGKKKPLPKPGKKDPNDLHNIIN